MIRLYYNNENNLFKIYELLCFDELQENSEIFSVRKLSLDR